MEVDLGIIKTNIKKIKKYTGRKFMACVKGDCYGMGMCRISGSIESVVDCFGVATTSEAVSLRDSGIKKPVLIMGPILPGDVETLVMNQIRITLFDERMLKVIGDVARRRGKKAFVHIKVDTGLGRIGVNAGKAPAFIQKAMNNEGIAVEGVFTHFATAGWKDKTYARKQLQRFNAVLSSIAGRNIPIRHIANSPAILNLPEAHMKSDMTRIGLLIFGVYPEVTFYRKLPLECAVKGFCRAIYVKKVPGGTSLSYGLTYTAPKTAAIATTGIGYADGLSRLLSNNFHFIRGGRKARIVGNICMDQTLVNVTGMSVKAGDIMQVTGDDFEIEQMAKICKTVPQEILCGFGSPRMEKVYKNA